MRIEGFNNYEICPEEGKIWSYNRNRYVGAKNRNGYWQVNLMDDNKNVWHTYIHRVIWTAVNGEIPEGYQVNHIDEDPSNNAINNLNLMTCKENINYGTGKARKTKTQSKAVVGLKDNKVVLTFASVNEAARNGFAAARVSDCCNGKQKKEYKGYLWKFAG